MKKIISIILVIIWMIVIFYFSSQNSIETKETTGLFYKLFHINTDSLFIFNLVRKFAHFFEYLILGLLIYNMFKHFNINNIIICTLLLCIIYSCLDEIHQLFVPGRDGKILDCLIDGLGSIIGIFLYKIVEKFHKRLSKN